MYDTCFFLQLLSNSFCNEILSTKIIVKILPSCFRVNSFSEIFIPADIKILLIRHSTLVGQRTMKLGYKISFFAIFSNLVH